jgi:Domain of unknown function (DUF4136)
MRSMALALLLNFFLHAPNLWAQTVKVNWQVSAPFTSYKTFAWQEPKNPGLPFYGQWVKPDVIAALNAKGLQQAAREKTPDLLVTYHIQGQETMDQTSEGFDSGPGPWGGGWGWYGGWGDWGAWPENSTTYTSEQPREMVILTVDLVDANHKRLLWRGQATVENASNSEKGDAKQTQQCVQKLFKSYPPKSK